MKTIGIILLSIVAFLCTIVILGCLAVLLGGYNNETEDIDEILADFYQHTDLFGNIIDCIEALIKEEYFNKEYLV